MPGPRFLFVAGRGVGPDSQPPWPAVGVPALGEPAPDGTWVSWRLAGSNHRELGRSTAVFADVGAARTAALELQQRLADLDVQSRTAPGGGLWSWRLLLDGAPIAAASRSYSRQRECAYSVSAFVTSAAQAELSEVVAGFRPRSHGSPEHEATDADAAAGPTPTAVIPAQTEWADVGPVPVLGEAQVNSGRTPHDRWWAGPARQPVGSVAAHSVLDVPPGHAVVDEGELS